MSARVRTERLGAVRARQVLWLPWMADATTGLADDDEVTTTSDVTPFGTYLLAIEPTDREGQ